MVVRLLVHVSLLIVAYYWTPTVIFMIAAIAVATYWSSKIH